MWVCVHIYTVHCVKACMCMCVCVCVRGSRAVCARDEEMYKRPVYHEKKTCKI